jgi:tetratricopeptide (TPR) repeat protein
MATYSEFYNKGISAKLNGDLEESALCHVKALEINPDWDLAEAWHNAGAALKRVDKHKQAIPYLKKALDCYQERIEFEEKVAYNKFWKACVHGLLGEVYEMNEHLAEAIALEPSYAEEALHEEDFAQYTENESFLEVIQPTIDILKALRFRGKALGLEDVNAQQMEHLITFRETVDGLGLGPDDMQDLLESDMKISPQASIEYCEHSEYCFRWSLHLDTNLLFFEMIHRKDQHDVKIFRLYLDTENPPIPQIMGEFRAIVDQVNAQNWTELIRVLIPYCKELLFEMPDGNKVKITAPA